MAKIKMKYHDFELEVEGEESFVENKIRDIPSVLDRLLLTNNNVYINDSSTKESPKSLNISKASERQSLNSFVKEKGFCNDMDLVLGVVYYLEIYDGKEYFTSKDIKECLKKGKFSSNMNIADIINKNIRKGYLEEQSEKQEGFKSFIMLNDGKDYIENYSPKRDTSQSKKVTNKIKKLTEKEEKIVNTIKKLDNYNVEDLSKLKELKNQKQIVMGSIYIIDKFNTGILFNSSILYEFIRFLGLNVTKPNISARMSEISSCFDKQEGGFLKLSNYGKVEIKKAIWKDEEI